ncbi:hypothetical protein E8E12_002027 [Didymella heteroderae]|uniref:Transmembrane protein n=1 Tax=Didymella heteroderae TaxID=1769908 RepID=A0A9P4WYM8_9PLEO|nr:hypothetical protein E8E12_002027 [Didymella heteroderae]
MTGNSKEFKDDPTFVPWGPFVPPHFVNEPISRTDIITASVVWGLTLVATLSATYLGYGQTRNSRSPLRSAYVWMIWIELAVCFAMGLECFLHMLKVIRPSFALYFTLVFLWCIQTQLLLQIVINRIRVIVANRDLSRKIMICTAAFVTVINISVVVLWVPARLQINHGFKMANMIWDRIEKVLYLLVDAGLNWYFLRTVKANLINNGLTKYDKLVSFNKKMVVLSLSMDVMIIAAMSIPNSLVYVQFHPLAYLVKLNIEMVMANLIKRIAVSTARKTGQAEIAKEFQSNSSNTLSRRQSTTITRQSRNCGQFHELESVASLATDGKSDTCVVQVIPAGNQIKQTTEVVISRDSDMDCPADRPGPKIKITGGHTDTVGIEDQRKSAANTFHAVRLTTQATTKEW